MAKLQERIVEFLDGPFKETLEEKLVRGKYAKHAQMGGLKGNGLRSIRKPEKKKDNKWWSELEDKLMKVGKEGKDYEFRGEDGNRQKIIFRGKNKKVAAIEKEYFGEED